MTGPPYNMSQDPYVVDRLDFFRLLSPLPSNHLDVAAPPSRLAILVA